MDPHELERVLDRELKALSGPRAPRTLLPRVLAAVEIAARRPWYARPWLAWPAAVQGLSLAVGLLLVAALTLWTPFGQMPVDGAVWIGAVAGRAAAALRQLDAIQIAGRVLWRTLFEPLFVYAVLLLALLGAMGVALAAALRHPALGGASQS
jgi:hypothetical protein